MNSLESFVKFIPSGTSSTNSTNSNSQILTDMESKAIKFTNSLNEILYETSNEPSLGFYRIQEHVRKSIPALIDKKLELDSFKSKIEGSSFDLDYSTDAVVRMARADTTFESIKSLLTDSLYAARQLNIKNAHNHPDHDSNNRKMNSPLKIGAKSIDVPNERANLVRKSDKSDGFSIGSFLSSKAFQRTSSVSIHENLNQAARNSPQRSQTMLISNVNSEPEPVAKNTSPTNLLRKEQAIDEQSTPLSTSTSSIQLITEEANSSNNTCEQDTSNKSNELETEKK